MARPHTFGRDYIIPAPFDPRLMELVPAAVAQAAMDSGVARQADPRHGGTIADSSARGSTRPPSVLSLAYEGARAASQAGDLRRGRGGSGAARRDRLPATAATASPVLVGRDDVPRAAEGARRRRSGAFRAAQQPSSRRWCRRWSTSSTGACSAAAICAATASGMVNQRPQHLRRAAAQLGDADAMISGVTRTYARTMRQVKPRDRSGAGPHALRHPHAGRPAHTVFMADTTVNERPSAESNSPTSPSMTAAVARTHGP